MVSAFGALLIAPVVVGVRSVRLLQRHDWFGAAALVLVAVAAVFFAVASSELFDDMWYRTACT